MENLIEKEKKEIKKGAITRNILILGLVSFFTDLSSEMVYPILPLYLTAVLGATPAVIGVIEGIAESLASLLKAFSGYIADKKDNKKQLAAAGYSSAFFNKIIILISTSWAGVLVARIIDKIGKGLRTAPRDALVAESVTRDNFGKAYGFHKAMDLLGSAVGILIAFLLLYFNTNDYKRIFIYSLIPAFIAPFILLFIRDKGSQVQKKNLQFRWSSLNIKLKLFLVCSFIFTLGNFSKSFLILRAAGSGINSTISILLYFVCNIVGSFLAYPIGRITDKMGKKITLVTGYFLYGAVYLGFAFASEQWHFWALFAAFGVFTAMTAGTERALIAEIAPENLKASALGLQSAVVGIGLLPASVIAGALWKYGQAVPFIFGGSLGILAAIAYIFVLNIKSNSRNIN